MHVRSAGFEVHYDPEARAIDYPASSVAGEFRRRVRIGTGSFRALPTLLRARKTGFTAFAFFSHKLLRWIVPVLLIMALVSNLFLLRRPFYVAALLAQIAILLWAGAGFVFRESLGRMRFTLFGYFLVAMHLAFLTGLLRSLWGRKETAWQRTN
jgi:hypothetical protein